MSEYESPYRNRTYKRKFDHAEAKRRHDNGESYSHLAAEYGVTPTAVSYACDPRRRALSKATSSEYLRRNMEKYNYDTCSCGNRKRKIASQCQECWNESQQAQIDERGQLWCSTGKHYLPSDHFPFNSSLPTRNFKGRQCRACATEARKAYRNRKKLPCVHCGEPALPPSEKGSRGGHEPRCRPCFLKVKNQAA